MKEMSEMQDKNYKVCASSPVIPLKGAVCLQWGHAHALFFPVRKFGLGSGQFQMLVVWPSLRTQKMIFIRRYWNLIRKYMEVQNGNINPHKHTSETSICKIGFPEKKIRNLFFLGNFLSARIRFPYLPTLIRPQGLGKLFFVKKHKFFKKQ